MQVLEVFTCREDFHLELVNEVKSTSAPFVHVFDDFESSLHPISLLRETQHSQFGNHTLSLNGNLQS